MGIQAQSQSAGILIQKISTIAQEIFSKTIHNSTSPAPTGNIEYDYYYSFAKLLTMLNLSSTA
jgi:hypothetical protein